MKIWEILDVKEYKTEILQEMIERPVLWCGEGSVVQSFTTFHSRTNGHSVK